LVGEVDKVVTRAASLRTDLRIGRVEAGEESVSSALMWAVFGLSSVPGLVEATAAWFGVSSWHAYVAWDGDDMAATVSYT
jgi:hypothetical protein